MSRSKTYALEGFVDRLEIAMSEHNNSYWARITGKGRKSCSGYRNGWTVPDATTLGKICAESGVSADWILFGGDKK